MRGGGAPSVHTLCVSPGARRVGGRGTFGLQLASYACVLLQRSDACMLAPLPLYSPRARRAPVAWLPPDQAGASAGWCIEHHGDGLYSLLCAGDQEPRRYLTVAASGELLVSRDPSAAFPARASLFSLEALAGADGGLGGWALRGASGGGLACLEGRAVLSALAPETLRIVDVAASASCAKLRADSATPAELASLTLTAVPCRRPASLQALAAAALAREPGAPPPCALTEAQQVNRYGAAYVPDPVAACVFESWAAMQRDGGSACKAPDPHAAFPCALRCIRCERPVFRLTAATSPGHHLFLESAAGRAVRRGPDSPGGPLWRALGTSAWVSMTLCIAAGALRSVLRAHDDDDDEPVRRRSDAEAWSP